MTEIMTLREFEQAIDEWGNNWGIKTEVKVGEPWIEIYASRGYQIPNLVAIIHKKKLCVFDLAYTETMNLEDAERRSLFKIFTKFASTPPADRKDKEKKYYLRHRFIGNRDVGYLNYRLEDESYTIWVKKGSDRYKSQFTMKEIEDLRMLYDTDLSDFELIEVEEKTVKHGRKL